MQPITLAAQVIWWDSEIIFAHYLCPFCEESHARSFLFDASAYKTPQPAHEQVAIAGNPPLRFRFEFPFSAEDGKAWYVIDKQKGRFVALGMDGIVSSLRSRISSQSDDITERLERLCIDSSDKRLSDDAEKHEFGATCDKTRAPELERKRIFEFVLEEMGRGNCRYLKHFLETSISAKAFLRTKTLDGNTALGRAARQPHPNIVQLLLKYGADVNTEGKKYLNATGIRIPCTVETPLLQAARKLIYDNMWHLLNYGARTDIRGILNFNVTDCVDVRLDPRHPSSKTVLARRHSSKIARKIKSHLLADKRRENPGPSSWRGGARRHFYLHDPQEPVRLFKTIGKFEPTNEFKTIAVLKRPGSYPDVAAMSGWDYVKDFTTDMAMLYGSYTEDVMQTGKGIGYEFPPRPKRDRGKPGRYHACHAEAKLIAFMVSKHAFLPSEMAKGGELHELANVAPSVKFTKAEIVVDNGPCESCKRFRDSVKAHCGLNIVLFNRSVE